MKLRLPHKFQAALMAALASVSITTLSSGTLAVATGAALLAGQQAQAEAYNGVEYSGDIFTIENKTSQQFHGATFSNMYWNGTAWVSTENTWLGTATSYVTGSSTGTTTHTLSNNDNSFWRRLFGDAKNGDATLLGNTIRLANAKANTAYEATFAPYQIGGIIAEESDYTYMLGRSMSGNCNILLKGQAGHDVNLTLNSSLILSTNNGVTVENSGTWHVGEGKSLQFGRVANSGDLMTITQNTTKVEFFDNVHVDMIGGGVVDITRTNAFTLKAGATISVGEGTTLRIATTGASVYGKALVGSGGGATAEAGSTDAFTQIFMGKAVNVQDGGKLVLVGNVCFNDTVTGNVDRTSGVADLEITGSLRSNVGGKSNPWVLGDHKMKVGGDFWLTNQQHFNLAGGTIEVGGSLKLGHEGNGTNGNYKASLNATAGSTVKLHDVMFYGGHDVLSVDGSSITFTKEDGNVLSQDQTHVPTAAADFNSVSLNNATLVAQENGWTLDSLASSTVTVRGASKLDIAGGKTIQIGNAAVSGSFTALEGSTGTLQLNDATFTGTVGITGANVGVGGTVTLDLANFNAFEVADATTQQYSYNNVSGFLTASGKYYLVHATGEPISTATWSGSFADGSATYDEASSVNGNIVFSLNSLPPTTSYYVNADMNTRNDVTGGTNNLLTKATDVCIKKGVTLTTFSSSDSFTNPAKLHGEGNYALASGSKVLNGNLSLGDDWTGRVVLSGTGFTNLGLNYAAAGTAGALATAISSVELKGVTGWMPKNHNANIILTNPSASASALKLTDGSSGTNGITYFTGSISGSGDFEHAWNKSTVYFVMQGDLSQWTGNIIKSAGGATEFTLSNNPGGTIAVGAKGNSGTLSINITNNAPVTLTGNFVKGSGTLNVNVNDTTQATFTGGITNANLSVNTGASATLKNTATLASLAGAGALVVDNGSNTVTVNGSNNYTGSITVDGGTLALGNHQFTGVPSLTINDGGTVTTNNDNGNGLVGGTITINAGGTLKATGGKDIFGYDNGATDKVVMQGSAEKVAKIDLSGLASGNSVTMTTDLEMKGYSTITGGAINSWDGAITVSGTGNTISDFALRKAVTIDVAAGGALEIGTLSRFTGFSEALTKTGAGTLTLKGGVIDTAITMSGGTLALDGAFTVDGLDLVGEPTVYYVGAENIDHRTNGVRGGQLDLQLLTAGSTGSLSITDTARFTYDSQTMKGSVGEAGTLHLVSEGFSSTFYINEASERTAWIFKADTDYPATDISIARGATLVVDDDAADGFSASKIHVQDGTGPAYLQIQVGNKVLADGTDRALQLSGAGEYKLNGSVGLGSISTAETTAATPWTGAIDATAVTGGTKLLDLLTSTNIHGGTVQLLSQGNSVTPGGTETALETNLANQGRTGNFTLADTTFTTGGAMRFNDWQNNHVWTVGSGSALQVGGDLWMDHGNKLAISGGNVTVGGKLLLGHSGGNKPTGLEMTGGSLKATQIDAYSSSASPQIPVSITGGTVEFTGTGNVLQIHNSAVCDVNIGGTGDNYVTLKADGTSWSLAHDGMTIGNIKAETTNGGAITLGSAGKAASYTGKVEVAEGSILTLDGILTLGANGIVTSGVLGVSNTTVFNLEHMEAQQVGDKFVYNVFTGAGANLSTQSFTAADNIIGISTAGKEWTFGNDGTISYVILSSELVWKGENGIGVWDTTEGNQPWLNGEASSAFRNDDEVTFDSTYSTAATATLGGNVEAAFITVAAGANVHVAQDAQEAYTLTSSSLVVNGSLQSDMPIYGLQFITVGENATWATANTLDITDSSTLQAFSNAGTIKLLSGARMDVDMTADKMQSGTVTAAEGGTLHLHNAPAGDGTFDGHNDFAGTLVYDVVSTGDHSNTLALENFAGTLELRGRLAASASSFGGMTKLVLNGDRSSNTTGLWNQNALTLDVPVEVKGDETVDLYTSNALTLTGDINSAGAKQGHLSKRNTGALNLQGGVYLLSYDNNDGTVNFSGGADIATLTAASGTVALGGQDKTYTLGAVALGKSTGGAPNLTIGAGTNVTADTVKVEDLSSATIVLADDLDITDSLSTMGAEHTLTIKSADGVESAKTLTTAKLDIANVNTGIALQNVILVVNGKASVAEIITGCGNNRGLVSVGAGATLNLNGGVNWSHDGKYVNLAIADGGTVNIATGESNVLNDVNLAAGGHLNLAAGTATTVQGTLTLAEALDISGNLTLAGAINIDGFSEEALVAYTRDDQSTGAKDGFKQYSGSLQVININGDAVFTPGSTDVTYKTMAGTLGSDGKFTLAEPHVYHDTYYVSSADKALSLNDAVTAATDEDPLLAVELLGGATLTADNATTVPTLRIVAGAAGEAATVSGATANFTNLTGEGALDVAGGATLNAGAITVAQGKTLAIGGEGTLGITSINGAGTTNVNAASVTGGAVTISGNGTVAFGDSVAPVTFTGLNVTGSSTSATFASRVTVNGSHVTVDYTNTATSVSVTFADGLAYTGSDSYALTIGNGDTVILGGTSDLSGKTVGIAGETGKLEVLENASVTVGRLFNSGTANNNGTVAVRQGGALTVGTSGNSTITNLSNAGTVTLNGTTTVESSFTNAGEVTLNGTTTVASAFSNTGSISVVGTSASSMTTLNVNNNGENLDMGAISLNNAELHIGSSAESRVRNISALTVDGAARLTQNSWNNLMHIAALNNGSGEGARTFTWQMNSNHYTNSVLYLDGAGSFDGTFVASRGNAGGNGAYQGHLQINHQQALQNAVLEVNGYNASNYMSVALNADKVETSGVKGNANSIIYAGEANTSINQGAGRTAPTSTREGGATLAMNVADETTHEFAGRVESGISLEKSGAGTQVFSGDMSHFNGSVDVEAGVLNIMNAASVNVQDVTIAADATLGVYNGATATADTEHEGTLTMKSGSHLKAGGDDATLNANLVMEGGSTLEVSLAQATYGLTMGCSLSLNMGDLLGTEDLGFVQNLKFGDYYYLYNGVDSLSVNGTQYDSLNFKDWTDFDMDASTVYTQLDEKRYALVYSWNGSNVGTIAITLIPEPTTGTLSLLALCALAARRRRK